jgi:hypothetical protein
MEDHDQIVNRLGNLTLLDARLNSTIRNGGFAVKQPAFACSELMLTKQLCEFSRWSLEEIAARQQQMAKLALTVWSLAEKASARRQK